MLSFLFVCDPSATARLIRRIGTSRSTNSDLEKLVSLLDRKKSVMRFTYIWEIWNRAEVALQHTVEKDQRDLLEKLVRSARFEVQTQARS
jgi:hypothetical protein